MVRKLLKEPQNHPVLASVFVLFGVFGFMGLMFGIVRSFVMFGLFGGLNG